MLTINNTIDGAIQDIEIKGNTVQNPDNLADIKSVGELQEDGTYKMSILSCGKNLANPSNIINDLYVNGTASTIQTFEGARSIYFKVKANTTYIISFDKSVPRNMVGITSGIPKNGDNCDFLSVNTVELTKRFSFSTKTSGYALFYYSNVPIEVNIQIEEGTVATPYEPYQENKCDILLPCQLEKVGDVSDRLYYDDVEKAWCIEKNIVDTILNGNENWTYSTATKEFILTSSIYNHLQYNKGGRCISDKLAFSHSTNSTQDNVISVGNSAFLTIRKDVYTNLTDFKKYLSENNILVKYPTTQPIFIPLPRNTQIQLNSFFGTTHIYMESGEVEGTIKCKISKSIGATVQSLNNKTDILSDRIEAIEGLKDSQNMKYETDKGYLVCKETKNGVIDDLKIEGKTLVNLIKSQLVTRTANTNGATEMGKVRLIEGNTYTVIYNLTKASTGGKSSLGYYYNTFWLHESVWEDLNFSSGVKIYTFKARVGGDVSFRWWTNNSTTDVEVKDFIILEGDHTQNPPSYFEGLMSVGQDVDKIEVLSCNENLCPQNFLLDTKMESTGVTSYNRGSIVGKDFIKVLPNTKYSLGDNRDNTLTTKLFVEYDKDKNFIRRIDGGKTGIITTSSDVYYIKVYIYDTTSNLSCENIKVQLNKGEVLSEYVPPQQDKKQILFYNENGELEPIQELHEWDSIEKHSDNKWYYHKRSGKVVLNGSENWNINNNSTNHMRFSLNVDCKVGILDVISDKFSYVGDSTTKETIFTYRTNGQNHGVLVICIDKSKLSTQDVAGFKQWLQANNVTVVYQLAQEEVYELAPLHLDSYANETLILCNSGAISPKMEFSITSHINELVKAYSERVNLLEEKVYKYMVTQNRMQLASTYSADSVTFKVDYFSLCGDEENYDEDLYNLILNNILVGKDNYNYDKMFTIILDYASWNQISWEQFDILVGLMDMQHNPPVEELPTEDEIEEDIIENEETPVE